MRLDQHEADVADRVRQVRLRADAFVNGQRAAQSGERIVVALQIPVDDADVVVGTAGGAFVPDGLAHLQRRELAGERAIEIAERLLDAANQPQGIREREGVAARLLMDPDGFGSGQRGRVVPLPPLNQRHVILRVVHERRHL